MKPDGITMETTEPTDAVPEPSLSQDNVMEQVSPPSQPQEAAGPEATRKINGKPAAKNADVKPKAVSKKQPAAKNAGTPGSNPRPGTAPARVLNDVKSSNLFAKTGVATKTSSTAKASVAGAVPKRQAGGAVASSTLKIQARVPDKKSVGPARAISVAAATVTNGTRATTASPAKRRPAAETINGAKPKPSSTASRPAVTSVPKPSTSTASKTDGSAVSKTTRPATARPASATSRPTKATTKPSTTASSKTAAPRVTTPPSSGRTATVQPTAVKKDVNRPPSASVAKKPATTTSAAPKKPEASKAPATTKLNSASKKPVSTQAADPRQSKTQDSLKLTKKPAVTTAQFPAVNKQPLGRPPLALPVNKSAVGTSHAKRGLKPTQAVPPFAAVKKTDGPKHSTPGKVQSSVTTLAAAAPPKTPTETVVALPQQSCFAASAPEEESPKGTEQDAPQGHRAALSPHSPERATIPQMSPNHEQGENNAPPLSMHQCAPAEAKLPEVASHTELLEPVYTLADSTATTSKSPPTAAAPQMFPPTNLNEEEDEEEKEGSQLVSVSEMSGTTQPTEESRPGSAGPVGGCAWRAGGALLSELDSEEVSGSQQGASELSAPGVLEGTESIDDLGDGSLKGAMDIEGASAGSPDFEKVPDIPVNDFEEEEDDEDDNDRVCDMDVGSEQAEDPQRPRHDNDVDDEEDEDVEMASEGVTESGLESYGNADEDDFVEEERLDNLNRMAQLPPLPHLLPSAPAAQWDQQNLFADPWAQPQQLLENVSQPLEVAGAAVSPLAGPWQADSETPTQSQAQPWLEFESISCVPENREVPLHPSVKDELQNVAAHMYMDQSSPPLMHTLTPAHLSAPGTSLSSTVSSETSTPEELSDNNQEKLQSHTRAASVPMQHQQSEVEHKDLGINLDGEEAEAETLPADEILGGPTTASSSSVTEDEASDTEGEAQLDDSLDSPGICHTTFENQPLAQRCLSTVEEGEEAEPEDVEGGVGENITLPSATSVTSGFDIMTSASNSNGQSTGESCTKSPGVFSLEELSEEAKEPCAVQQDHTQSCMEEQRYIEYGNRETELTEGEDEAVDPSTVSALQPLDENPDEIQPPYYKAFCEQTEDSFAGFTALPYPHTRDHSAYVRTYCDIVKPHNTAAPSGLTCADLPPRNCGQQTLSPQLLRLEQHQRQLLEMQQRREQQNRPLEEVEQERKRREEEEQRKKKDEAEEEIKRNEEWQREDRADVMKRKGEELQQRRELELQLQQQQQELKQRQQIMQWQQELQQAKGQTVLLSPSSGLCTIYEALENSEEEAEGEVEGAKELNPVKVVGSDCRRANDECQDSSPSTQRANDSSEDANASCCTPDSSERPPPLDLDWGKKVDIVQQLINQTLLLNGDGCSSLLLLPGGGGGTLSPLESSLWPNLLPPLTPPSATVTSVSSFSPEATGSSPQGEWTVVELETHH